jgi:hypothetical protein
MTERTNDSENHRNNPSRPEGQDTSEAMDNKTQDDINTTAVLPPAETPPTQEIAQATARVPEGPEPEAPAPDSPATDGPAPEGEVHPAYGVAAARVQQEEAASAVQDAPAHLTQPQPVLAGPAHPLPGPAQAAQPATQAAQAATKRGPRVGTAVWGLIVIAVGLGILAVAAGVVFDIGAALIVLLGAAGVILVVGSVVSSLKRR